MKNTSHGIQRPYLVYERTAMRALNLTAELGIVTPNGIVVVHTGFGETELRFAHAGTLHTRYFDKEYTQRYCITLAVRFSAEIVGVGE